jgi:hypothetical protein
MNRFAQSPSLVRAILSAVFLLLAIACAPTPTRAQRGISVPRVSAPRPVAPARTSHPVIVARPIRPRRPVFPIFFFTPPPAFWTWGWPFYGFGVNPFAWTGSWYGCTPAFAYAPAFDWTGDGCYVSPLYPPSVYAPPFYAAGEGERDLPQLYMKDGTVYNVTDYWVVDGQLHFSTLEAGGARWQEHTVPLDDLDLQKTVDVANARGFHFVLRNQPLRDYLREHPDEPAPPPEPHPPLPDQPVKP